MAREAQHAADERLAVNMRRLREAKPMSQTAFATAMLERGWPWHQSTVYRVESGRQTVRLGEADDIAAILGTTLDQLTRPSPEADTAELVLRSSSALRRSSIEVARAVAELLAAQEKAEQVLAETNGSKWARVRDLRTVLADRAGKFTLDEAVAEGIRSHERGTGQDAADTQGQP